MLLLSVAIRFAVIRLNIYIINSRFKSNTIIAIIHSFITASFCAIPALRRKFINLVEKIKVLLCHPMGICLIVRKMGILFRMLFKLNVLETTFLYLFVICPLLIIYARLIFMKASEDGSDGSFDKFKSRGKSPNNDFNPDERFEQACRSTYAARKFRKKASSLESLKEYEKEDAADSRVREALSDPYNASTVSKPASEYLENVRGCHYRRSHRILPQQRLLPIKESDEEDYDSCTESVYCSSDGYDRLFSNCCSLSNSCNESEGSHSQSGSDHSTSESPDSLHIE